MNASVLFLFGWLEFAIYLAASLGKSSEPERARMLLGACFFVLCAIYRRISERSES